MSCASGAPESSIELVLAHQAAQALRQRPGARFQRRVGQHFVRARRHSATDDSATAKQHGLQTFCEHVFMRPFHGAHSAGCAVAAASLAFAGRGAPTRSRRSDSDRPPPKNMKAAPSQIISTCGLK